MTIIKATTSLGHSPTRGFTLIELLIVVAIIAILAALAIPNFMEAQARAKVSRASADFRTVVTALEAYRMDTGRYPKGNHSSRVLNPWPIRYGYKPTLERLSTPIAYLTGESAFYDPFKAQWRYDDNDLEARDSIDIPPGDLKNKQLYWYAARNMTGASEWDQPNDPDPLWYYLESAGPDLAHHNAGTFFLNIRTDTVANRGRVGKMIYDPTNGSLSRGSVWRVGGIPAGYAKAFYFMVNQKNGG